MLASEATRKPGAGDAAVAENRLVARTRLTQAFDAVAFKAAWLSRCAALQIDAARGATAYQVEFVRDRLRHPQHWGQDWLRYTPVGKNESSGGRDRFESERFAAIERYARSQLHMIESEPVDLVAVSFPTLRELWAEVRAEMLRDAVPLRSVQMTQLTMDALLADIDRHKGAPRVGLDAGIIGLRVEAGVQLTEA